MDAKDTGIATLGPVRIFNRAKDLQPLRRTPTLIEKMFPTVRFRHDLAKKEDAINSTLAMHRTETEMKFAMLEAKQRELERKLAEKDMIIAAQDGLMSSQSTEEIKTRLASAKAAENELQKKVKELEGTLQNKEMVMKSLKNLFAKLAKDDRGGEVLEYALIAGLIVVAAIAIIGAVGTKVVARWDSLNNSM